MTYSKPEVVKLDSAVGTIQGTEKGGYYREIAAPHPDNATTNAYESDE